MSWRGAVFLDKDGTVLRNEPYNVDPARMELLPGAADGLRMIAQCGYRLVVVTNQSGVALGRFPEDALGSVATRLKEMFIAASSRLAAFYYCPHDPRGRIQTYARQCDCRKPHPGLIWQAARDLDIDVSSSWMIGDILNDVEAGRRAGCRTILIDNGGETEWQGGPFREPEYVVRDLAEAATVIRRHHQGVIP